MCGLRPKDPIVIEVGITWHSFGWSSFLWPLEFGFLAPGHLCYVPRNSCPKNQFRGSKSYSYWLGSGQWREGMAGEAGHSALHSAPSSTTGPLSGRHNRGAEKKRPKESTQSRCAQTRSFITRQVPITGNSHLKVCKSSNLRQLLVTLMGGAAAADSANS